MSLECKIYIFLYSDLLAIVLAKYTGFYKKRGCAGYVKLFLSIVNRFTTHFEVFHNFLIGDFSSLEGDHLVMPRTVSRNLMNTLKQVNYMKIYVSIDKRIWV